MKKLTFLVILPCSVFLGLGLSTQWTAIEMHEAGKLGIPLWVLGDTVLYAPWQFIIWYKAFGKDYPELFNKTSLPAFLGVVIGVLAVAFCARQKEKKTAATTYGSSRWSTAEEISHARLLDNKGVLLGKTEDAKAYIRHDGPEHILALRRPVPAKAWAW